ncbi:MAG: tryptophan synthase alpha chain, partial [Actinomycetota bacterium]
MITLDALRVARDAGRKLLVPYMTGGLGGPAWVEALEAMVAGGADAVEIGIPFSDPVMDGPTIQEASQAALDGGATPAK